MKNHFIMKTRGRRALLPVVVGIGREVENIFAVPAKDAIGTIDIDNALSYLEFDDESITVKIIKKDFAEEVSGAFYFSFLPRYSDDEITYAQSRWLITQNVKTKKNRTIFVVNNLDDWVGKLAVLNAEKGIFVVEVLKGWADGLNSVYKKFLGIGSLKEQDFVPNAVVEGGLYDGLPGKALKYHEPWTTAHGKLFVYDNSTKAIKVYDEEGVLSSHPVATIFHNNRSKFRRVKEMVFHPELPFVLIVDMGNISPAMEELDSQWASDILTDEQYFTLKKPLIKERDRHAIWLIRWDTTDEDRQLIPLMSQAGNLIPSIDAVKMCSDFQFSPNGEWLVFRDITNDVRNPVFISIPVSEKYPAFFGEPLYLGQVLREGLMMEAKGTAWIDDPTSFVVTDGLVLYKWELGSVGSATVIRQGN